MRRAENSNVRPTDPTQRVTGAGDAGPVGPTAPLASITECVERMAAAVSMADADDLPRLAELHAGFQRLAADAPTAGMSRDAGLAERLIRAARAGERLVEQVMLREAADADAAVRALGGTVMEVQQWIRAAVAGEAGPVTAPAVATAATQGPAAPPAPAAPAAGFTEAEPAVNPDDVPLAREFIAEATGHLQSAEANLLKLEGDEGHAQDPEAVNAIFRSFHTIKGVAGFLNLKQIGAVSHAAENLLDLARKGQLALSGGTMDLVLASLDVLGGLLAGLEAAINANRPIELRPDVPGLLERLHAAAGGGHAGHVAAAAPIPPAATPAPAGQSEPAAGTEAHPPAPGDHPAAVALAPGAPAAAAADGSASRGGDANVKVSTERLDSLINLIGELVVAQSMVSQDTAALADGNHRAARNLGHLGKITRELQDLSMSMRMVPIQGAFQKMSRVIRDLCRKAGKEIDLVIEGGDTELDRNVVDAIADPLVHMVRNAADHGIEPPDARAKAGKPRTGRLTLRARHQAGTVVVEIADDGRGLNRKRIVEKATAAGLVRPGQELSEQDAFRLIFAAGLSTAEKVTDISGRGVGMDVVKKNVEALRGRIDIQSVEGAGTTFTIRLPLTLAVIDGLVVRVGRERYIVPITSVEQSLRPRDGQISTVLGRGETCRVRDRLLPLVRLYGLFNVAPRTQDPREALVVVVQDDTRRACLLVDELVGQQQVVIKSLGDGIGHVSGVSGGAILGDGNISLILDVPGLIHLASGGGFAPPAGAEGETGRTAA